MSKNINLILVDGIDDREDLLRDRSRYTIEVDPRGFTVSSPGRVTTYVALLEDNQFFVVDKKYWIGSANSNGTKVGPYNFRTLLASIVNILTIGYKRPPSKVPAKLHGNYTFVPPSLKKWLHKKIQVALNHRIHEQWARLIALIPENINTLAKAMFRSTLSYNHLINDPSLYKKHPYLVKDLTKYFSANAMFTYGPENYLRMTPEMINTYVENKEYYLKSVRYYLDNDDDAKFGRYNIETGEAQFTNVKPETFFRLMENWRILYSYNQKPYRALDITLDNVTNVSGRFLVKLLQFIRLERPIYERLELCAILGAYDKLYNMGISHNLPHLPNHEINNDYGNYRYQGRHRRDTDNKIHNANLFQYATVAQIRTMMERVGNHVIHQPYNHRKISQIISAISYVLDYPEQHNGNIVGLADKAIDWHRDVIARMEENRRKGSDPETLNALPPIPLPEDEHITFLAKVGDLFNESDKMMHCVYSYRTQTIQGYSFIFHVEKDGDVATIEVNSEGKIIQASGIHNRQQSAINIKKTNAAILYGKRVLSAWGKKFNNYDHEGDNTVKILGVMETQAIPFNELD